MATPISLPKGYLRLGDFPLDESSVFDSFAALQTYASTNGTAYAGQICAVKDTGLVYVIRTDLSLSQVGATPDVSGVTGLETALAGKADLVDGKVPASQLPSYVDDVLEFANLASFPAEGETGKIYIALDSLKTYRWGGSVYAEISSSEVTSVAGKTGAVTLDIADVEGLQADLDAKQLKTVYADTAPANHADSLRWVDTTKLVAYDSFDGAWVEIPDSGRGGSGGTSQTASVVTGLFFVSKNGSDSNPGTLAAPFLTIQHAINQVPLGTVPNTNPPETADYTIFVAPGVYDENLTINRINIHIVGMTDDALQNKAVLIRGTTNITATGSGSVFNNTIVLNNLTLANTSVAGYTVSSTGSKYSLTLKNTVVEQDNSGFGAVNIANTTNDTRTYFDNTMVIANPAGRNALDFSAGIIADINDSTFYANGAGGVAINITSSNAWIVTAKNSAFQSVGKALTLSTNNQATSNLSSFTNCTITGIPASSTTGIVSLGGGTQAAFSFTRCNVTNLATNASSDHPFFELRTAAIAFLVGNIFASLKPSAVNFQPVYAVTTAAPNAVLKYQGNSFASNKATGTDTVVTPTVGVGGWAIVESLKVL